MTSDYSGKPDQKVATNLNGISANPETGSSQLKLNLNLDIEVQVSKSYRVLLIPQFFSRKIKQAISLKHP
jgi:hypothetical protein